MQKNFYIYIMANESETLYIGVTNNLKKRVWEHKNELVDGFTRQYKLHKLVYFEHTSNVQEAITREKILKSWVRRKKLALIHTINPDMNDLYEQILL